MVSMVMRDILGGPHFALNVTQSLVEAPQPSPYPLPLLRFTRRAWQDRFAQWRLAPAKLWLH